MTNPTTPKFNRKTYDAVTKARIVNAVRSGQKTMAEVCKEESIQPYQVLAWIGERALADDLARGTNGGGAPDSIEDTSLRVQLGEDLTNPDLARVIGEWWLKTHAVIAPKKK